MPAVGLILGLLSLFAGLMSLQGSTRRQDIPSLPVSVKAREGTKRVVRVILRILKPSISSMTNKNYVQSVMNSAKELMMHIREPLKPLGIAFRIIESSGEVEVTFTVYELENLPVGVTYERLYGAIFSDYVRSQSSGSVILCSPTIGVECKEDMLTSEGTQELLAGLASGLVFGVIGAFLLRVIGR